MKRTAALLLLALALAPIPAGASAPSPTTAVHEAEAAQAPLSLLWDAEPLQATRLRTGAGVLAFLAVFAVLLYILQRRAWAKRS